MDADQLKAALRPLTVPERLEVLRDVDLPRSVKLNSVGAITSRARQLGLLDEVERALAAWRRSK